MVQASRGPILAYLLPKASHWPAPVALVAPPGCHGGMTLHGSRLSVCLLLCFTGCAKSARFGSQGTTMAAAATTPTQHVARAWANFWGLAGAGWPGVPCHPVSGSMVRDRGSSSALHICSRRQPLLPTRPTQCKCRASGPRQWPGGTQLPQRTPLPIVQHPESPYSAHTAAESCREQGQEPPPACRCASRH